MEDLCENIFAIFVYPDNFNWLWKLFRQCTPYSISDEHPANEFHYETLNNYVTAMKDYIEEGKYIIGGDNTLSDAWGKGVNDTSSVISYYNSQSEDIEKTFP